MFLSNFVFNFRNTSMIPFEMEQIIQISSDANYF
jgi:hypothetical protein